MEEMLRRTISEASEPAEGTSSESAASEPAKKTPRVESASKNRLGSIFDEILEESTVESDPQSTTTNARTEIQTYLLEPTIPRSDNPLLYWKRISFLSMEIDSVAMCTQLTSERAQSVLTCLRQFEDKSAVPLKLFQRLLGHMASAAAVTPLGLLHMRPLQLWLRDRVPSFLRAGVPLERVSRHVVVSTDASTTGWGAMCNGHAAAGSWTGPQRLWHVNCLELLAVRLALHRFRALLKGQHVLVRSDNTATVAYINHQGGLRFRRMSQLARHLLIWSQKHLRSLRAIYIPGDPEPGGRRAVSASASRWRMETPSPVSPADLGSVRGRTGRPVCLPRLVPLRPVLFPDRGHARHGCTGAQLAAGPTQVCVSPSEPSYADLAQDQGGRGAGNFGCPVLAQPDLVLRTNTPRDSTSLANSPEEGPAFSGTGHPLAPSSQSLEPPRVAPGRDEEGLSTLPPAVVATITSARASSTRHAYALKWNLFVNWCSSKHQEPTKCPISVVLSFLQEGLERRLSPSTLKVYVAAIAAHHDAVDGKSLGKHDLIIRFLRQARRLNPPRPPLVPSWDLSVVLTALQSAPFEPLQSVELKFLSMKTALLVALASIKRVRDLQAFSVDEACLEFGPANSHVILRPRPGYVPKVPTTPFRDQVVNLQALPLEEADPALALLCPVHALRAYIDRTRCFRTSDQLFVCYGGKLKGKALSKQRLSHWIVDAIALAYQQQGRPCPLGVTAHSTRSVASSWASHGASLTDICRAAGWATPNTFVRLYNLRVVPVSSHALASTSLY
ncbi:unnamed protein product [Leuciscus chuanchicus]